MSDRARAGWHVESYSDRMTGMRSSYAAADADYSVGGVLAEMRVERVNGRPEVSVHLSSIFPRGPIAGEWSFDGSRKSSAMLHVFNDPSSIPMLGPLKMFAFVGRQRFRLQLAPRGSRPLYWEFDISGLTEVLPAIRCDLADH